MKVSQLLHVMDKDDVIVIDDYDAPIDNMTIYIGSVREITRDNPINKMHIQSICANKDTILVLATKPKQKGATDVQED